MKNFESFEKEYDAIMKEYLSNSSIVSDKRKVSGRPCLEMDVLYNGKEYILYDYSNKKLGICDLLLVPKYFGFKDGICDDVIKFGYSSYGIGVQKYSFSDDTIERESYDYIMTSIDEIFDESMVNHFSSYSLDRDELSKLFSSCETVELFFTGLIFSDYCRDNIISSDSVHLMRSDDLTKYIVVDNSDIHESFQTVVDFMQGVNYNTIDDNKSPLFDIAKRIRENNKKIG